MITRHGFVRIEPGAVHVEGFHFSGVDIPQGRVEALQWALARLKYVLDESTADNQEVGK